MKQKSPYIIVNPRGRVDDVLFNVTHHFLDGEVRLHTHSCVEFTFFEKGFGRHISRRHYQIIHPGDVCVTLNHGFHGIQKPQDMQVYNITCSQNLLDHLGVKVKFLSQLETLFSIQGRCVFFHLNPQEREDVMAICDRMFRLYSRDRDGNRVALWALMMTLMCILAQAEIVIHAERKNVPSGMDAIMKYIDGHFREPLDLAGLAAMAGLSPGHFIKVFKDSYSLPPIDYVREVRLNEACRMLLTTNLPLSRIAAEVGWGSVSNFIHYFVSKNDITPARYRRINRNPQL